MLNTTKSKEIVRAGLLIQMLIMVFGLYGCALEKELPPARDSNEIDDIFTEALKKNKALAEKNKQQALNTKRNVLDALLPPISSAKDVNNNSHFDVAVSDLPAKEFYMGLVEDTHTNIIVHPY
jgi:hypothetical protein